MQWPTLAPEIDGVQRLNADRRPAGVRRVEPVAAAVPVPAAGTRTPTRQPPRRPGVERRRGDRRSGSERRDEQRPVLLDTRCGDERRSGERRQRAADAARTHINLYA